MHPPGQNITKRLQSSLMTNFCGVLLKNIGDFVIIIITNVFYVRWRISFYDDLLFDVCKNRF